MGSSIFVTSTQRGSGKSLVALGLVRLLEKNLGEVGYFKPIGQRSGARVDPDVRLMKEALGLEQSLEEMAPCTMDEVSEALTRGRYDKLVDEILEAHARIAAKCDFVVCEGTDYFGATSSFEFDINADLSKNLGAPILLVASVRDADERSGGPLRSAGPRSSTSAGPRSSAGAGPMSSSGTGPTSSSAGTGPMSSRGGGPSSGSAGSRAGTTRAGAGSGSGSGTGTTRAGAGSGSGSGSGTGTGRGESKGAHGASAALPELEDLLENILLVKDNFDEKGCELFGVVVNRADPKTHKELHAAMEAALADRGIKLLGTIPRSDMLERLELGEIARALDAEVISGNDRLDATAQRTIVAAMSLENVLKRVNRGDVVVVPGDRDDVILGMAAAYSSPTGAGPSGLVLSGGLRPGPKVMGLLLDLTGRRMPMLGVASDTYETAVRISKVKPTLQPQHKMRIDVVIGLVERWVAVDALLTRVAIGARPTRVTPKQFIHRLIDLARGNRRHIVLPEGKDERILRAAHELLERDVAELTLLGVEEEIRRRAANLGLALDRAHVIDPAKSELREGFARRYIELRAPKTPTWDTAYDLMSDPSYFGTMMVKQGLAHGMVSGAINTTAHTLRPALEFVKCKEGIKIASSVFFMCLPDAVLVYGDCAVNPSPTAEELADIAIASAETARAFEIEPVVAMLSYSTGDSGKGSEVDHVRQATRLVKERRPDLPVEGPIQYDAAVDPSVARTKLPGSKVAGVATVFIFPDLNSGNNTYKAVQRAAKAIAIGPVMQGLRMPVNDLSRGCTVPDIVNTVAITAIQAQRSDG